MVKHLAKANSEKSISLIYEFIQLCYCLSLSYTLKLVKEEQKREIERNGVSLVPSIFLLNTIIL